MREYITIERYEKKLRNISRFSRPMLTVYDDAFHDQMLIPKVQRVCTSVTKESQLLALRKYCHLAKLKMRVPLSVSYVDAFYAQARDRVFYVQRTTSLLEKP